MRKTSRRSSAFGRRLTSAAHDVAMYPAFISYLRSEGWNPAFNSVFDFGFAEGRRPMTESYSVRTSLSRTFLHDGQIGLSPIARSTLSSKKQSSVVGLRPSAKTTLLLADDRGPTTDGEFGLRKRACYFGTTGPVAQVARAHP